VDNLYFINMNMIISIGQAKQDVYKLYSAGMVHGSLDLAANVPLPGCSDIEAKA
jgi:hypothetical protein